jgi:hypothetical protein
MRLPVHHVHRPKRLIGFEIGDMRVEKHPPYRVSAHWPGRFIGTSDPNFSTFSGGCALVASGASPMPSSNRTGYRQWHPWLARPASMTESAV